MKVNVDKLTETEKKLYEMLREIRNDNDFIIGVLNVLENDAERDEVIKFISDNGNALPAQITLLALNISLARENIIKDAFFSDLEKAAEELKLETIG